MFNVLSFVTVTVTNHLKLGLSQIRDVIAIHRYVLDSIHSNSFTTQFIASFNEAKTYALWVETSTIRHNNKKVTVVTDGLTLTPLPEFIA